MKNLLAMFLCLGLVGGMSVGLVGCKKDGKTTTTTTTKTTTTTTTAAVDAPKITVAGEAATVEQGKSVDVKITLIRTKADKEVKVTGTADDKTKVTAKDVTIAEKKTDGVMTVSAADDAPVGEVTLKLKAKGEADHEAEVKITVKKKEVVADPPKKDPKLEIAKVDDVKLTQVEKKGKATADLKVTSNADAGAVTLKLSVSSDKEGKVPAEKVTAAADVIKAGVSTVTITTDDAKPGDYYVWITATGAGEGTKEQKGSFKVIVK